MRSVVIIGRKSIERMLGLLCIIAATLIFGMSVKAAGPEEIAYVYLDEDVVGTSGVQNIVVGFQKEEMVIGGARLFYQTESGTEGTVEAAQILYRCRFSKGRNGDWGCQIILSNGIRN